MDAVAKMKDPVIDARIRGHQYVCAILAYRDYVIPLGNRLYVKKEHGPVLGLPFCKTTELAAQLIREFQAPTGMKGMVLFDAYYLCHTVVQACRDKGFPFAFTLQSHRCLYNWDWRLKAGRHGQNLFRRRCTTEAAIIFSTFLLIYLANGRTLWSTDTPAARFLPLTILREGDFDLNEFLSAEERNDPAISMFLTLVKGRYVSMYPVGGALLALPFYLPSAIGWTSSQSLLPWVSSQTLFLEQLEKLSAATLTALPAVVLNLVLRRLTSRPFALIITIVYALGTSSLSVSSQAL